MSAEAYPLYWPEGWKRTSYRKNSAFKIAAFGKARDFLLAEVKRMGGRNIVLSTNIALRNDGHDSHDRHSQNDCDAEIWRSH